MKELFDVLQEKHVLLPGPGASNVKMINAVHPFLPQRPILLQILAKTISVKSGKDSLCEYTLGGDAQYCHRFQSTVWEMFSDDDDSKKLHFSAYLHLLKKFIDKAVPSAFFLRG